MEEVAPSSGIKDYIVDCRKKGYPDPIIINNLKKSSWPDDIINIAIKDADRVIPAIKEEIKPAEEKSQSVQANQNNDLFTKAPIEEKPQQPQPTPEIKVKKKFSVLSVIAFFLSPIPFIGLGASMMALEDIQKNKKSGMIIGILALLISLASVFFLLYLFYQIFTMPQESLTGFSKAIVEKFNLFG